MKTYYRFTNSVGPMSDWGHAMFTDDDQRTEGYGNNKFIFVYDGENAVNITKLKKDITETWQEDCQEGFYGDFGGMCDEDYWSKIDAEDIYNSFNPIDIVDTADAWDSELTTWIWERVLDPMGINAIITNNGCIVFDSNLIQLITE